MMECEYYFRRMKMSEVNLFLAFGAGFLSFISPCVLPLFPAFLSYITGMSVSELNDDNKKLTKKSMLHTVLFLLGFSRDRKSTRLNSSHVAISYAVFCLKKKKKREKQNNIVKT